MGYDLHITRREFWADDHGPDIPIEEWLALVETDQDLERAVENGKFFARFLGDCEYGRSMGWFDWQEGCVYSKNPDEAILGKMLEIAKVLNAKVQGDDGEIYTEPDPDSGFHEPKLTTEKEGFFNRFLGPLRDLVHRPTNRRMLPFGIGDRVKDAFGSTGTVTEIDPKDNSGLGNIVVVYDDGRVLNWSISAHGFEKLSAR